MRVRAAADTCPQQYGFNYSFFMCSPEPEGGVCLRGGTARDNPYAVFGFDGVPYAFSLDEPWPCAHAALSLLSACTCASQATHASTCAGGACEGQNPGCAKTTTCWSPKAGLRKPSDFRPKPNGYEPPPVLYLDTSQGQETLVSSSAMDVSNPPDSTSYFNCADGAKNGLESDVGAQLGWAACQCCARLPLHAPLLTRSSPIRLWRLLQVLLPRSDLQRQH